VGICYSNYKRDGNLQKITVNPAKRPGDGLDIGWSSRTLAQPNPTQKLKQL